MVDSFSYHLVNQIFFNGINHTSRSLTIPEINSIGLKRFPGKHISHVIFEIVKGAQAVGALFYGNGTLGIGSKGQAGDAKISSLFLDTAGISQGEAAVKHQIHKSDVINRF